MQKGNINGELCQLTYRISNAIPPLSDETSQMINLNSHWSTSLWSYKTNTCVVYKDIDKLLVMQIAIRTYMDCRLSELNAGNWHGIWFYNQFWSSFFDFQNPISSFVKSLFVPNLHHSNSDFEKNIETARTNHLIPLNKNPALCQTRVDEMLR